MENMKTNSKPKNLLQEEKENSNEEGVPSTPQSMESFLEKMGVDWEKKGRAYYIYPSSLEALKVLIEKMPLPEENEYVIIPLGSYGNYNVFVMGTRRSLSIRIGFGRNSVPYSNSMNTIVEKLGKIAKDLGLQNGKNPKNLLE